MGHRGTSSPQHYREPKVLPKVAFSCLLGALHKSLHMGTDRSDKSYLETPCSWFSKQEPDSLPHGYLPRESEIQWALTGVEGFRLEGFSARPNSRIQIPHSVSSQKVLVSYQRKKWSKFGNPYPIFMSAQLSGSGGVWVQLSRFDEL